MGQNRGMELDTHELAWAAGFFDGEGCFSIKPRPSMSLGQIDPQVLARFQRAVGGLGILYGPYGPYPGTLGNHGQWYVRSSKLEDLQATIAMLWRWLSPIKREQARRLLKHAWSQPGTPRQRTRCKHGHSLADAYVRATGKRQCRTCDLSAKKAKTVARRAALT
jgi:hypothetical protein